MRLDVQADASLELKVTTVDHDAQAEALMGHCVANGPPKPVSRPDPSYPK